MKFCAVQWTFHLCWTERQPQIGSSELPRRESQGPLNATVTQSGFHCITTCHCCTAAVERDFKNVRFLSSWALSSSPLPPSLPTWAPEYSRVFLTQMNESKLSPQETPISPLISNHLLENKVFLFSPHSWLSVSFLPGPAPGPHVGSGSDEMWPVIWKSSLPLRRYAADGPRVKGAGGEGNCERPCWSAYCDSFRPAGPNHHHLCHDAAKAREKRFSGPHHDWDLVVINVALMLHPTLEGRAGGGVSAFDVEIHLRGCF